MAVGLAEAGARLVICDINPDRLKGTAEKIRALGGEVLSLQCDVSDSAAVDTTCDELIAF